MHWEEDGEFSGTFSIDDQKRFWWHACAYYTYDYTYEEFLQEFFAGKVSYFFATTSVFFVGNTIFLQTSKNAYRDVISYIFTWEDNP